MEYFWQIMKKNYKNINNYTEFSYGIFLPNNEKNWKSMNNYTEFSYGIFLPNNEKKLESHEIISILCISTIK